MKRSRKLPPCGGCGRPLIYGVTCEHIADPSIAVASDVVTSELSSAAA